MVIPGFPQNREIPLVKSNDYQAVGMGLVDVIDSNSYELHGLSVDYKMPGNQDHLDLILPYVQGKNFILKTF